MPKDISVGTPNSSINSQLQGRGKHFEQIALHNLIGRGTFSKVYLAKEYETGELIAVKIMDLKRFEQEFNSEVSMLMSLTHKGINVGYRSSEIDEDNETGFIYLDYIPFPTLSGYLEKFCCGLHEHQAFRIFRNLLNELEEIHSCRVAHKDLKPENIFVDPDSNDVTIIDFGLSAHVHDVERGKTFCGSPLYMAPEMLNKEVFDPILTDVWSLGVILYEMLIGCNPWSSAETLEDLMDLILQQDFPNFLSQSSINLLSGMLRVTPKERDDLSIIKLKIQKILENC